MKIGVSLLTCRLEERLFGRATVAAVTSLLASDLYLDHEVTAICVDNGSAVGSEAFRWLVEAGFAVMRLPKNEGIAPARNRASQVLLDHGCQYIVEMHNDHVFPGLWAMPLFLALETRPRLGMLGTALVTGRGVFGSPVLRLDYTHDLSIVLSMVEDACALAREQYAASQPRLRRGLQHPVIKRAEALRAVGLYDETFKGQNFEDTDEVRRMEQAGWEVMVSVDSFVYHHYNLSRMTIGDPVLAYRENRRTFREKWSDSHEWLIGWDRALQEVYRP